MMRLLVQIQADLKLMHIPQCKQDRYDCFAAHKIDKTTRQQYQALFLVDVYRVFAPKPCQKLVFTRFFSVLDTSTDKCIEPIGHGIRSYRNNGKSFKFIKPFTINNIKLCTD